MKKRLSKHGNSLALVIDKPILNLVGINEKTILSISTDGNSITIKPMRTKKAKISNDAKMQQVYENLVEKYAPALQKLAKN